MVSCDRLRAMTDQPAERTPVSPTFQNVLTLMPRRRALMLLAAAPAAILAACGGNAPAASTSTAPAKPSVVVPVSSAAPASAPASVAPATAKPAAQPKSGGTLRTSLLTDISN